MKALKKLISMLLCPMLLLPVCACGSVQEEGVTGPATSEPTGVQPTEADGTPLCDGKTLKILAITSSFGVDTTDFLYEVAKAQGATDVTVARLYFSGCTLAQHVDHAENKSPVYQYTKNDSGEWKKIMNADLIFGLTDEDWDIIYLQQSAAQSAQPDTYKDFIDRLMAYVNEHKTNPDAKFVWNMTWAYQSDATHGTFVEKFGANQMTMYNALVSTLQEKVLVRQDFDGVIPTGTAIQNARTSFFGDTLTRDGQHLSTMGRVIAAYTVWATLTGKPLTEIKVSATACYNAKDPVTLTEKERAVILESVNNALANPLAITPSDYTQK